VITAKNYAAQVEHSLRNYSQVVMGKSKLTSEELATAEKYANAIRESVHFVVPDGGTILQEYGGSIVGKTLHLPYGNITIEWYEAKNKYLALALEQDDTIEIVSLYYSPRADMWQASPYLDVIIGPVKGKNLLTSERTLIFPSIEESHYRHGTSQEDIEDVNIRSKRSLVELCEALACRNVSTEVVERVDRSVNARRIKDGKRPIYETKMLVINATAQSKTGIGGTGFHASPRQHLRRGHIRRLKIGNIWVNSCVVGDSSKGIIEKQYAVM